MRPLSFLAVLSAVLSAGAAYACCIFKSAGPGPPVATAPAAAATAPAPRMLPTTGYVPYLEISTVGGYPPDSTWNVAADLSPDFVEIIVDADATVWWVSSIDLFVTDLGRGGTVTPTAAKEPKRYKVSKRPELKLKTIKPKSDGVRAEAAPSAPAAAGITKWVWELTYSVAVEWNHRYSAYAQGDYWNGFDSGTATSHTVTFHTKLVEEPPSKGKGPPDKK
jgi:hypothetical protein